MSGSVSRKYVSASEDAFCYVTALRPVIMWKCGSIHFDVRPTQLVQHLCATKDAGVQSAKDGTMGGRATEVR